MKRNKHSLSHYRLLTCDMGKLYPIGCFEVLPGDTVQQATAMLMRVSPLEAPVMHPVSVRVHHWFVPNRLVWDNWEEFITGGSDGLGDGAVFPTLNSQTFAAKSLADYFGIPPTVVSPPVSALPFRAYALIFNEHYRDQDLVPELPMSTADGADVTTSSAVASIAWEKDYFTNARPWPQKGPDVSMPLAGSANVRTNSTPLVTGAQQPLLMAQANDGVLPAGNIGMGIAAPPGGVASFSGLPSGSVVQNLYPANLFADLSTATSANVNDVRRAFALQRYQEARAMYGSRYTEYLRYLGVRSSDARLQRPEYLGGGKQTISFSEVLRTGSESSAPIGEMFGHGIAALRSRRYRRFFEEHGHVISLLSVRPRTMYNDGVERMWNRRTKEDFWQRELELIGQQEILNKEIFSSHATPDGTFGYQDRYSEYRHLFSKISGDFRTTLNYWHLGRIFASAPALNQDFVECDPSKRIHSVQTEDVLWNMVSHSIQARRMVGRPRTGRII